MPFKSKAKRAAYDRARSNTRDLAAEKRQQRARPDHKQRQLAAQKPRPFVAIDSEGVSYGPKVPIGDSGDLARVQRTVFWGAAGVDDAPRWLRPVGGLVHLGTVEILDWLLTLPEKFGRNAIFIWFGSSYDATQLFVDLPYDKAWELQHGKPFPRYEFEPEVKARSGRFVFWKDYGFSYIKSKCVTIGRLRNRDCIRKPSGSIDFVNRITIFDVFGFFQTSFLKSAASIPGSILGEEFAIIEEGKAARADFTTADIDSMMRYTECELHVLARMLTIMRDKLEALDIRLTRWQGAGSIASALLRREGAKDHMFPVVSSDLSQAQEWAHHAFFGGRIECLKQGRTDRPLWQYDVRSAYPSHMAGLPSMAGGEYEAWTPGSSPGAQEAVSRETIETSNVLSMFKLRLDVAASPDAFGLNTVQGRPGPQFYPLPYRDHRGGITYPPNVYGIYMQSEVVAAFAWLDYWRAEWRRKTGYEFPGSITVEAGMIFKPANTIAPFDWLRGMYDQRREIVEASKKAGTYDLAEKILKLGINSVYGKTAQSVGSADRPPGTACPWFAAAVTAGTRAQLLLASIPKSAHIVAFQTDGIVSTGKLHVCEGTDLGLWEVEHIADPSVFIQPGVYHLGRKSKNRGIKPDLLGVADMGNWLDANAIPAWRDGLEGVSYPYRYYLTLGSAVASPERWAFAGWWVDGRRELQLNNLGHKRAAPILQRDRIARAQRLVDTLPKPAYYHDPELRDDLPLSYPHRPDWLDQELRSEFELAREMEEIMLARDL